MDELFLVRVLTMAINAIKAPSMVVFNRLFKARGHLEPSDLLQFDIITGSQKIMKNISVFAPAEVRDRTGRKTVTMQAPRLSQKRFLPVAALNALLEVDEPALTEANAGEIVLERGRDKRVAIVGHFPFIERVRAEAAECWVLELKPAPGDLPASRAPEVLPQADVVALTGTSLLNHTFEDLIGLCRPDAFVLLLGPSTPLTPVLFETGVDAISGTLVADADRVLRSGGQGATFRQIKRGGGLRLLTWLRA